EGVIQRHQPVLGTHTGPYGATSTVPCTAWQRRQLTVRFPSLYITSSALPCRHASVRVRRVVRATCTTGAWHVQQGRPTTGPRGSVIQHGAVLPRDEVDHVAAHDAAPHGVAIGERRDGRRLLGVALHAAMRGMVGGLSSLLMHAVCPQFLRPSGAKMASRSM